MSRTSPGTRGPGMGGVPLGQGRGCAVHIWHIDDTYDMGQRVQVRGETGPFGAGYNVGVRGLLLRIVIIIITLFGVSKSI